MTLQGKVALVTGSTSGIGLGIARALAAQGASLMINGFGDPAAIEALRAGLAAEHGVSVLHDGADVSQPAPIHAMIARTQAELGGLDILVNNAGIQHVAANRKLSARSVGRHHCHQPIERFPCHAGRHPGMKARGWGRIINIASAHGLVGSAEKSALRRRQARHHWPDSSRRHRTRQ